MAHATGTTSSVDDFLKIQGIDGEAQDGKHKNEIELLTWRWSEVNDPAVNAPGKGFGSGRVQVGEFEFAMRASKASPKLMLYCAAGTPIPKAMLTSRKAGGEQQEYLKITLVDCLITHYAVARQEGDVLPIDNIRLFFGRIEFEYSPQKANGTLDASVKTAYDRVKRTNA